MRSFSMKGRGVPGSRPKLPVLKTGYPEAMVFEKSPVSPSWWPVAMAEALAVVKVGKREWEFEKKTPFWRMESMVGAVWA